MEPSLRERYVPLRGQALARVDVAMRVAVMARLGLSRKEMAEQLDVRPRIVRQAIDDLVEIADEIELGERPEGDYFPLADV